jgi:hypothetical protein
VGRVICWGGYFVTAAFGYLGVPFATAQAIATCAGSCLAVSSTDFISFSNNAVQVVAVEPAMYTTCGKDRRLFDKDKE